MSPETSPALLDFSIRPSLIVSLALTVVIVLVAALTTRRLRVDGLGLWQTTVEMFIKWIEAMVREIMDEDPEPYVPLIGTIVLFIAVANLLSVVPLVSPPTGDLSIPVALALTVFFAVPFFGIRRHGLWDYLRSYVRPHPLLLPLNLLAELTRTVALAVRLFGNMMSAQMVGAILLLVAGFLVPIPLMVLGIITALVQAYIFGVLAAVFIAAAVQAEPARQPKETPA